MGRAERSLGTAVLLCCRDHGLECGLCIFLAFEEVGVMDYISQQGTGISGPSSVSLRLSVPLHIAWTVTKSSMSLERDG
jgi:hypothetical protein